MPLYDVRCLDDECAAEREIFCAVAHKDDAKCHVCGGAMRTVVSGVMTVGPTFSKPITYDQVGLTFDSKKEADAYTARTGNRPASPEEWQKVKDMTRERADAAAQRQGYRDVEHRNAEYETKTEKQHFVVGE